MNVDAITIDLVKQTLIAWQKVQEPPPDIFQLDLLRQFGSVGKAEMSLLFYDYVRELIESRLQEQRLAEGIPHPARLPVTRPAITAVLQQDFRCENKDLEIWSTLYHHYFVPSPLDNAALNEALPTSYRNYSRRRKAGLRRLAQLLSRAEMEAHHRYQTQYRRRHIPSSDYLELVGVDKHLCRLETLLTTSGTASFVSIEGLGGIGKTALAQAAAHQLAAQDDWQDVLWVSAKQQRLGEWGALQPYAAPVRTLDDIVTRLAD